MRSSAWLKAAAAAVLLVLSACSTATLTSAWLSENYHGPAFQKILVLGIGADGATRRIFEDSFAASLARSGVQAYPGYTLLPGVEQPTPEQIKQAALRIGADAALVTRLLRVEQKTQTTPGYIRSMPAWGYSGGFYGFYGYYRTVAIVPPTTTSYDVAELETNLWALNPTDTLVWSATSQTFSPDRVAALGTDLATSVSEALKAAGLLNIVPSSQR